VRGGHGTTWSGYGRYSSEKIAQRKNTAADIFVEKILKMGCLEGSRVPVFTYRMHGS
jgi:Fe2+ transport system protein FeoA